jgi:hypothetical protein
MVLAQIGSRTPMSQNSFTNMADWLFYLMTKNLYTSPYMAARAHSGRLSPT